MVCLEAQIMGTPVIVYKNSGAVEAVINGKTGIIFKNQNVKSLKNAVYKLDGINFNRNKIIENAKRFSKDVFESQLLDIIKKQL